MGYEVALTWMLWGLCLAPTFVFVVVAMQRAVNVDALADTVARMLRAQDPTRVLKLTQALPGAPSLAALRAAVERASQGASSRSAVDYRTWSPEVLADDVAAVRRAWNLAWDTAAAPLRTWFGCALCGGALAITSGVLWLHPLRDPSVLAPLLAGAWAVVLFRRYQRDRDVLYARLARDLEALLRAPAAHVVSGAREAPVG